MGKPLDEARWDLDDVADCFDFYAGLAVRELGPDGRAQEAVDVGMEEFKGAVVRQPAGVVGLISPWNYPLLMATWKVVPALAAGAQPCGGGWCARSRVVQRRQQAAAAAHGCTAQCK